jgi:alkaline phosphatase D
LLGYLPTCGFAAASEVYQATGLKVGEVTPNSAIVWTRLTSRPERNPSDGPRVEIQYVDERQNQQRREGTVEAVVYPPGITVDDLREAVPGAAGQTRVRYRVAGEPEWMQTSWESVDAERDFTRQFLLEALQPQTEYELQVEGRWAPDSQEVSRLEGGFRTAPLPDVPARVVFTVSTGQGNNDQDRPDGWKIYPTMLELRPDFFVHTGDIVYYDQLAKTLPLARYHWQRTYSWPTNVDFHRQVASYFEKDDHDTWLNDCWPTMQTPYMHEFTFAQGQAVFLEQVPMGQRTYRSFRWGRDLQIWLVEGRDFRSANDDPDGPDKTIWGVEQKEWFKRTLLASDATFRVLISPTPLVGPDRSGKNDNHANSGFDHEGLELREFLGEQKNLVVVCGDRHWQYMSVDPATGTREYSCGPASNAHAGGWSKNDYVAEYHRFLRVKGGFLSATVERLDSTPNLTMRFHGVDGKVYHTDTLTAAGQSE